jgi:hypothetical protein
MSRLPSVVTAIAKDKGVSVRTVQRRFKAGKFKGVYRPTGGHWRFRKPRRRQIQQWKKNGEACWIKDGRRLRVSSRDQYEQWKKIVVADVLRRLMVLVQEHDKAYHDKALKLAWLLAGITKDDLSAVFNPDPLTRRRNRAALKKRDYRKWQLLCQRKYVHPNLNLQLKRYFLRVTGREVTRRVLASALGISMSTFYRRFGRENVQKACRGESDLVPPGYWRKSKKGKGTWITQ